MATPAQTPRPARRHPAEAVSVSAELETLRKAAAQIRDDRGGVVSRNTQDGRRWLPVADWLDDLANRIVLSRQLRHEDDERYALLIARAYLEDRS